MVDEKLFDAFAVVAGALHSRTIGAVLKDLEGWVGPDIEACRQAFAMRRQLRERLEHKRTPETDLVDELWAILELLKTAELPSLVVDHLLGQALKMTAEVKAAGFEASNE
jgi:hypothetical protein